MVTRPSRSDPLVANNHLDDYVMTSSSELLLVGLDFPIEERPRWRSSIDTCTMIQEISRFRQEFCGAEEMKVFCKDIFVPGITEDYIVNIGEQNEAQAELEKENIREAMKRLDEVFVEEMEGTGLLDVDQVCKVHMILMNGLHEHAGEFRDKEAYTAWDGKDHYYPPPDSVKSRLERHIDSHNYNIDKRPKIANSIEETEYVIKCAARLMFEFVNTHPFGDGNGRMCRLLANRVLAMITPFPVYIYHNNTSEGIRREDYVNAIVQCRDHLDKGPCEIAAMLAEGVWNGWKSLRARSHWFRKKWMKSMMKSMMKYDCFIA